MMARPPKVQPKVATADGFTNFAAKVGLGADNLASASQYSFDLITRNRQQLEAMYRGSWLIGMAVDAPAEDMTRAGISITSTMSPGDIQKLDTALLERGVWEGLTNATRWGRLFGGALAVLLIEGHDMSQPLRLDTVENGSFKGLLVLDRWMVSPSTGDVVTEFGPNLGKPAYYDVVADSFGLPKQRIHYSRVIRFEGIELPYFQRLGENLWSESVVERIYDRLVAFDSTTLGTAQLVYRAHLRTMKVKDYRNIVAQGGVALSGLTKQIELMRLMQSNEGVTLMDADDTFEAHSFSFSGLSDVLMHFGEQVSGAVEVPLVRLFGQSPAGLSSSGESDLRTYYDGINKKQEQRLRTPLRLVLEVLCRSELGIEPPEGFSFVFNPLWLTSDKERADIGQTVQATIQAAYESGMIRMDTALKELRQWSRASGMFTNITEEEIEAAKDAPPPNAEQASEPGINGAGGAPGGLEQNGKRNVDARPPALKALDYMGLPLMIETPKGGTRRGPGWSVVMPADYGYVDGTGSAEGHAEGMDIYVGPHRDSHNVYIVDQANITTGAFDEHKCMLGYLTPKSALADYTSSFSDGRGTERVLGVTKMTVDEFKQWLASGDISRQYTFKAAAE